MIDPDVLNAFLLAYTNAITRGADESPIPMGLYQHYKGGLYMVTEVCRHTETQELLVRYWGRSGAWVRPLPMFLEEVETEAGRVPRFRFISQPLS